MRLDLHESPTQISILSDRASLRHALGRNPTASGKHVQCHTFAQEDMSRFSFDCSDMLNGIEGLPFF